MSRVLKWVQGGYEGTMSPVLKPVQGWYEAYMSRVLKLAQGWYEASMPRALKLVQGWYYGKSLPGWCRLQSYQSCRVLATSIDTNVDTRCISEEELQFWGGHLLR
jgi:hypothetical protein